VALKGEAKKIYQRHYMRKRRGLTTGSNKMELDPPTVKLKAPQVDADGNLIPDD